MGKLSTENLKKLLSCIKRDTRVVVPPLPGFDSGVHLVDDTYLVVSTDPCTGVPEKWFGWLLIHYAASDVALFGAKPEFCTVNLLGSLSTKPKTFQKIMLQTCQAAEELQMAIVTGHTGTYRGLSDLFGVCTAYGKIDRGKLITPRGAKPGDYIFCTKPLGLEVAVNLALTNNTVAKRIFGSEETRELAKLVPMQSCVREALLLAEVKGVHAMHDATEGGLAAALNEMAEVSGIGFTIDFDKIPICKEVETLQERFHLTYQQLLSMSSTGTILASVDPEAKDKVEAVMHQNNVVPSVLGVFTEDTRRILKKRRKKMLFPKKIDDPYSRILSGQL